MSYTRAQRREIGRKIRLAALKRCEALAAAYRPELNIPFARAMCDSLWAAYDTATRYVLRGLMLDAGIPTDDTIPNHIYGRTLRPTVSPHDARLCASVRRTWLRHWEETGEALNAKTWHEINNRRAQQRMYRKSTENRRAERHAPTA